MHACMHAAGNAAVNMRRTFKAQGRRSCNIGKLNSGRSNAGRPDVRSEPKTLLRLVALAPTPAAGSTEENR